MNIILGFIDAIITGLMAVAFYYGYTDSLPLFITTVTIVLLITLSLLGYKKVYSEKELILKSCLKIFEGMALAICILDIIIFAIHWNPELYIAIALFGTITFLLLSIYRVLIIVFKKLFKRTRNVLIVGAGQDGKLIAEEIKQRPELKLNVVGFLDDNMNNIEDEDSSIKILGLTCDSEAVIKDNNVKLVIIAVKSRMDSDILTDLVKGIPLGVKVWRMYRFYEKISHKFLVSKMSVNWLFYDCVRKKALIYSYLKRFCDIVASLAILILTSPVMLIAAIGIKLTDLGPIFFTQMRAGRFGKPFKMIKFRSMYHDKVKDDFDDDVTEISPDDKRIMPFCKILRRFRIDELPQMINVLRGDMSIVGPRPVREEVYDENKENIPFWECRNWVRPGWCGWQQVNVPEPEAEQFLGYDLYYIKHQNLLWDILIFIRYVGKVISGKTRTK